MSKPKVFSFVMLILVLVFTTLVGCSSTGKETSSNTSKDQKIKLTVASWTPEEHRLNLMNETIIIFNQKYPNIEIEYLHGQDYRNIKMQFSAGEGPDIIYVDDLNQQTLQQGNYLMDITDDVKKYNWIDKQIPGAVEFNNLRTPGKYYSVPFLMAPVVVYYNKNIFNELKLSPPKTLAEFNEILEKVKNAGYIPFENAGILNFSYFWAGFHVLFGEVPMEDVAKWYYREETTDRFKEGMITAFKQLDEWGKKGYFREEMASIDFSVIPSLYAQGKSVFFVDGDWDLATMEGTNVPTGIFAFPPKNAGDTPVIVNTTDSGWALNAKLPAEKKQAALDFIDIFMDPGVVKMWYEGGFTPSVKFDATQANTTPLKKELNEAVSNTQMGFYLDNAVPGLLDVFIKQTQLLAAQQQTPEETWEAINNEYVKLKKEIDGK